MKASADGNTDPTPAEYRWKVDTVSPNGRVSINDGRRYTSSRKVTLELRASDPAPRSGVAEMRIRNGGRSWSEWKPYDTSQSWQLTRREGKQTVNVEYRDRARNVSATASDSINYRP